LRDSYYKPHHSLRYPKTPPEFFIFGWLGMDGVSYGYLVHAPELGQTDYPICEEQPQLDSGLTLFGENTPKGIEGIFSRELSYWKKSNVDEQIQAWARPKIEQLVRAYNIAPVVEKDPPSGNHCIPYTPKGWRFEPSADGVGALAPESAFAPYGPTIARWPEPIEPALVAARRALDDGYPATALLTLRSTFYKQHLRFENNPNERVLLSLWAEVYRALNRPVLASVLRRAMRAK
jgi:hypothetical protein